MFKSWKLASTICTARAHIYFPNVIWHQRKKPYCISSVTPKMSLHLHCKLVQCVMRVNIPHLRSNFFAESRSRLHPSLCARDKMKPCEAVILPHLATFIYNSTAASNQAHTGKDQGHTQMQAWWGLNGGSSGSRDCPVYNLWHVQYPQKPVSLWETKSCMSDVWNMKVGWMWMAAS